MSMFDERLLTVEQVEKIHEIIENYSTDVVDYELATDNINAVLWPNAAQPTRRFVMTAPTRENIVKFIKRLDKLAATADALELTLPNGGIVGSLLGSMASDLSANLPDTDFNCRECYRIGGVIVFGCEIPEHKAANKS